MYLTEFLFSSPKLDIIETPMYVDAPLSARPSRNRHSVRLRISALSAADIDGVVQDLDALCADVVRTHTMDADKYGEVISGLNDLQVLT